MRFSFPAVTATVFALWLTPAYADSSVLKCVDERGEPAAVDLKIDPDKGVVSFGVVFTITKMTDRFITAINEKDVGTDVIVLDRVSGAYKITSIGLFCNEPPPKCTANTQFQAFTHNGKCGRAIF